MLIKRGSLYKALFFSSLLLVGCDEDANTHESDFAVPDVPKEEEQSKPKEARRPLESGWYEKINITLTKDVPMAEMLKSVAQRLDLKLVFNIKDTMTINYSAKNKPFIEVLSDICELNDWKLRIKGKNAKVADDSPYMHTYSIPYLIGERKGVADTSFSGSGSSGMAGAGSTSGTVNIGSSARLSNDISLNAFEELRKNIEMIASTEGENAVKFSMHKQAGILTVVAKQKVHRMITKYINLLSKQMRNQISIEARIYEIHLHEKFATGVDWSNLANIGLDALSNAKGGAAIPFRMNSTTDGGIGVIITGQPQRAAGQIIQFLRRYGKVHSLSNPKVMITNNNFAVFKVVDNKVFFKISQQQMINPTTGRPLPISNNISSEIHTIPVGIIMLVQPSIDEHGKITIALHPTITEVEDEKDDPAISMMAAQQGKQLPASKIPIVKTRELDTVFTVEENKVAIIGGLLYNKKEDKESGVPLSWLGSSKERFSEKREIVIAIKAKIVYCQQNPDESLFLE